MTAGYDFNSEVSGLEKEYGIPAGLYRDLLLKGEGADPANPHAVSPKGALGLAQLMPGTARDMGVEDVWDPEQNLRGGAKYFRHMYDQFGDWDTAIGAYNAGPGATRKAGGIPSYAMGYVTKVKGGKMPDTTSAGGAVGLNNNPASAAILAQMQESAKAAAAASADEQKQLTESTQRMRGFEQGLEADAKSVPLPPTLRDLPTPPDPQQYVRQPVQALQQLLPAFAILAGAHTRLAATTAFKAAAGAMNAMKKNDQESFQRDHDAWKDSMDSALKSWEMERDRYLDVINNTKMSMDARLSELRAEAAISQNTQLLAAAKEGDMERFYKLLQATDTQYYHLKQIDNETRRVDIERQRMENEADAQKALAKYREAQGDKHTMSQLVADWSNERREDLASGDKAKAAKWAPGSPRQEALDRAEKDLHAQGFQFPGEDAAGAGGESAADALAVPAGAKPGDLQAGKWYQTPQGALKWTGTNFTSE